MTIATAQPHRDPSSVLMAPNSTNASSVQEVPTLVSTRSFLQCIQVRNIANNVPTIYHSVKLQSVPSFYYILIGIRRVAERLFVADIVFIAVLFVVQVS